MDDGPMVRRSWTAIVALVAALAVVGLVVGLSHDWSPDSGATATGPEGDTSLGLEMYALGDRIELPAISGRDVDGEPLATADYPGTILVLNLWGSWCGPCRAEAPDLAKVSKVTKNKGVQFLGIDTRDNPASARAFQRHYGITYPSFDDQDGSIMASFPRIVPLSAVPSTVFVDADGTIAARVVGRVDDSTLRGIIEDLIEERDGAEPTP